jgi:hypothetical protein
MASSRDGGRKRRDEQGWSYGDLLVPTPYLDVDYDTGWRNGEDLETLAKEGSCHGFMREHHLVADGGSSSSEIKDWWLNTEGQEQSAGKRANSRMLGMPLSLMTSHKATRYFTNAFFL